MTLDLDLDVAFHCMNSPLNGSLAELAYTSRPLAWIGSGLSRIVAELGASRKRFGGGVASAFTPYEFCQFSSRLYLPVLVSYGGGNQDSVAVAKHITTHYEQAVLLTRARGSKCEQIVFDAGIPLLLALTAEHSSEHRFLALRPLLASCAVAHRLVAPFVCSTAFDRARSLIGKQRYPSLTDIDSWAEFRWVILAGGLTYTVALAWQVLLAESAVTDAMVVDIKDFTHARYLASLRRKDTGYLILSDPKARNLALTLRERLSGFGPVVLIDTEGDPDTAMWLHLINACSTIESLCQDLGWSVRNPPKPREMRRWNNWGQIMRCE